MANYLIKPIGGLDIEILDKSKFKNLNYSSRPDIQNTLNKARYDGEDLLKQIKENNSLIDFISLPIIEKGLNFCKTEFKNNSFNVIYIITDQKKKPHYADTFFFMEIIEEWNKKNDNLPLKFIILENDLSEFNTNYDELSKYFNNEEVEIRFNYSEDKIIVFTQAGLPETRVALLLHCIQRFTESNVIQIAAPQGSNEAIKQKFPEQFVDNLRKQIFPHALKETLAIISAKNLSHTDGSHVMPWFESAFNSGKFKEKGKEVFSAYNTYLRNTMELTADLSGGMGNQSYINYSFEDIGNYLTGELFSKKTESHFLGEGLTDGEGQAILEIDDELKKEIVSLPGGENGKTALVAILKNFFRNLYKHSEPDSDINYRGQLKLEKYDSNEFFKISLTEESKAYSNVVIDKTVNEINSIINRKILNEDLTIKETGWGIMEMKIAAAYLIGLPMELFEGNSEIYPVPFIEAIATENSDKNYHLAYIFYLLKPKIALVESNAKWKTECPDLPQGFDWLYEINKGKGRTRHEFLIRKSDGEDVAKLKSSNIKQVYLNSMEELKNYLTESALRSKWIEGFQQVMPCAQNIQARLLNKTTETSICYENNISYMNIKTELNGRTETSAIELQNLCVFDDHGGWHKEKLHSNQEVVKSLHYYEKYNTHEKPRALFTRSSCFNVGVEDVVKETILTKIAILDERIQKYTEETHDIDLGKESFNLRTLYGLKNVYIPSPLTNEGNEDVPFACWDINTFSGDKCSLKALMYDKGTNSTGCKFEFLVKILEYYFEEKNCHYVVLHLSGFETIVNDSSDYLAEKIPGFSENKLDKAYWYLLGTDVLGKHIKDKGKYLVLTSGKGTPKTLPDNSYFISLSNLEFALKQNKYELVKQLNSVRKIKKYKP